MRFGHVMSVWPGELPATLFRDALGGLGRFLGLVGREPLLPMNEEAGRGTSRGGEPDTLGEAGEEADVPQPDRFDLNMLLRRAEEDSGDPAPVDADSLDTGIPADDVPETPVPGPLADQGSHDAADLEAGICPPPIFVARRVGMYQGAPVFDTAPQISSDHDFTPDEDGHLVNEEGYYLIGRCQDPSSRGRITRLGLDVVRMPHPQSLPALATGEIAYRANLPEVPRIARPHGDGPGQVLLNSAEFSCNPTTAGAGAILGYDVARFLDQSVAGGSVSVHDVHGTLVRLVLRWAKIESAMLGGRDVWNLFFCMDREARRGEVAWRNAGAAYAFDRLGQPEAGLERCRIGAVAIEGHKLPDLSFVHGKGGLSQFEDGSGMVKLHHIGADGHAAGALERVWLGEDSHAYAAYDNGFVLTIADYVVADSSAGAANVAMPKQAAA